jgi:histidinol dehydrogenase
VSAVAAVGSSLKTYTYDQLSPQEIRGLLQRPRIDFTSILNTVGATLVHRVRRSKA